MSNSRKLSLTAWIAAAVTLILRYRSCIWRLKRGFAEGIAIYLWYSQVILLGYFLWYYFNKVFQWSSAHIIDNFSKGQEEDKKRRNCNMLYKRFLREDSNRKEDSNMLYTSFLREDSKGRRQQQYVVHKVFEGRQQQKQTAAAICCTEIFWAKTAAGKPSSSRCRT